MNHQFKPGDPVWARSDGGSAPVGEHPATVVGSSGYTCQRHLTTEYYVLVNDYPSPAPSHEWRICGTHLRPRRDDYQQHERLGSWSEVRHRATTPA